MSTSGRVPLVERSITAKRAGGPKNIRKMPKLDRLWISRYIAKEIGRERAADACARGIVREHLREGRNSTAAAAAETFGFKHEMVLAAKRAVYADVKRGMYSNAIETAMEFGLLEDACRVAKKIIDDEVKAGHVIQAEQLRAAYANFLKR